MKVVFVAVRQHEYGQDVRVFVTRRQALSWQNEIVDKWWDYEMPSDWTKPDDPYAAAADYFGYGGSESLTIHECYLEG